MPRATAQEKRSQRLIDWGFLKIEAQEFSKVNFDRPNVGTYWKDMLAKRYRQYEAYQDKMGEKYTREAWVKAVQAMYTRNKWYKTISLEDGRKTRQVAPWKYLKHLNTAYKAENPSWASPYLKRSDRRANTRRRVNAYLDAREGKPPQIGQV